MNKIEIKNVSYNYPNGFLANDDINLIITSGERVAIVGQNGAGKTTLVKMMNGLYKPSKGDVIVDGKNTKDFTTAQIAKTVGYVFQNPDDQIFNRTVYAEIAYMPRYYKDPEEEVERKVREVAKLLKIEKFLDCNPFEIPYVIRKFVTIAAVLATQPGYVILDEPTAGQDLRGTEILAELLNVLENNGIGVVTITHDMEFVANNFKKVIAMANKKVISQGRPQDILGNDEIMKASRIKRTVIGEIAVEMNLGDKILRSEEFIENYLMQEGTL